MLNNKLKNQLNLLMLEFIRSEQSTSLGSFKEHLVRNCKIKAKTSSEWKQMFNLLNTKVAIEKHSLWVEIYKILEFNLSFLYEIDYLTCLKEEIFLEIERIVK